MKKNTRDEDYMLTIGELRQLLFWATGGIEMLNGGSYDKTIIPVIRKLAKDIKFPIETKKDLIRFGKYI